MNRGGLPPWPGSDEEEEEKDNESSAEVQGLGSPKSATAATLAGATCLRRAQQPLTTCLVMYCAVGCAPCSIRSTCDSSTKSALRLPQLSSVLAD